MTQSLCSARETRTRLSRTRDTKQTGVTLLFDMKTSLRKHKGRAKLPSLCERRCRRERLCERQAGVCAAAECDSASTAMTGAFFPHVQKHQKTGEPWGVLRDESLKGTLGARGGTSFRERTGFRGTRRRRSSSSCRAWCAAGSCWRRSLFTASSIPLNSESAS